MSAATAAHGARWRAALPASLAQRLTLGLVVSLIVSVGVLVALATAVTRASLRHEQEAAATRLARVFEASLQNAMLKRDLDGMAGILAALGQAPGVSQARLAEPRGTVRFASDPRAIGSSVRAQWGDLCVTAGCAAPAPRLSWQHGAGAPHLRIAYPIHNQARCAQCHGAPAQHPVNGVLLVDFEPPGPRAGALPPTLLLSLVGLAALVLFALLMALTLRRQVTRPLGQLAQAADRLAAGQLDARVRPRTDDELGRVGRSFDRMAENLDQMVGRLDQQRRFLQTLIDAVPDPVLVLGLDHRIRLANRAYAELLGHDPADIVGQCCHRVSRGLAEPCPSTLLTCPLAEIRRQPQPVRSMMSLARTDGTAVEVDIEAAAVTTAEGETLVVEVLRPLDRQLRFSQQQRLSTIGLLANGVAHEIHNPLASIRLALQASLRGLRQGGIDREELVDYLQLVDHEIDRCVDITRRLMQMSQSPAQSLQPVDLAAAIDDVLSLLREECRQRQVAVLGPHLSPGTPVLADEAELRQVLVNLIHNALHAMPQGGAITLSADVTADARHLRLQVQDTGCGIAAEDQPLIFMPFFSRRADGQRGSGLGLAISKAAMERFGGAIEVHSTLGQGSTFTLTFQRATAGVPDNAADAADGGAA
jgi:PAS domain S-box-containing protein